MFAPIDRWWLVTEFSLGFLIDIWRLLMWLHGSLIILKKCSAWTNVRLIHQNLRLIIEHLRINARFHWFAKILESFQLLRYCKVIVLLHFCILYCCHRGTWYLKHGCLLTAIALWNLSGSFSDLQKTRFLPYREGKVSFLLSQKRTPLLLFLFILS